LIQPALSRHHTTIPAWWHITSPKAQQPTLHAPNGSNLIWILRIELDPIHSLVPFDCHCHRHCCCCCCCWMRNRPVDGHHSLQPWDRIHALLDHELYAHVSHPFHSCPLDHHLIQQCPTWNARWDRSMSGRTVSTHPRQSSPNAGDDRGRRRRRRKRSHREAES